MGASAPIARDHGRCRNKRGRRVGLGVLPGDGVLVPEKEEQFIPDDGTPDRSTELSALQRIAWPIGPGGVIEEVIRVQIPVPQKLEQIAMKFVGAGFSNGTNSSG